LTPFVVCFHRPLQAPFEVASHQHQQAAAFKIDSPPGARPHQQRQVTGLKIDPPPGTRPHQHRQAAAVKIDPPPGTRPYLYHWSILDRKLFQIISSTSCSDSPFCRWRSIRWLENESYHKTRRR
jgi:hypothetical protein